MDASSGDCSPDKLGAEEIGGLGEKPPGKISKSRPLDLRETPFFIIDMGPF